MIDFRTVRRLDNDNGTASDPKPSNPGNRSGEAATGVGNAGSETSGNRSKINIFAGGSDREDRKVGSGNGAFDGGTRADTGKPETGDTFPTGGETVKKRRGGRPKGSTNKSATDAPEKELGLAKPPRRDPTREEITGISQLYMMGNNFVAMSRNAKDFVISAPEANSIGEPLAEVLADWGIYLSGANNNYVKLVAAMIGVYGARVMTRYMTAKTRREEQAAAKAERTEQPEPSSMSVIGQGRMKFDEAA